MDIHLLYGTESGNAEMLCEDIEAELSSHSCEVISLDDVSPGALEPGVFYILVTSTYGTGDLPATAQAFYEALTNGSPDLSGIRFAIFGLGDMMFPDTYNHGSVRLMEAMLACKAEMIGDREVHDASSEDMPEDIALPWVQGIIAQMQDQAA